MFGPPPSPSRDELLRRLWDRRKQLKKLIHDGPDTIEIEERMTSLSTEIDSLERQLGIKSEEEADP